MLWWGDEQDEAIAELAKVVEAARAESELRLDLAELLEQQRAYADALAVADAVQPLDNMTLRRREELALRLAVSSGDVERARHAAERLFGLRLDTDTQVRLAGQMHQLGLHELAEAVLGRARRRAGNKATALVGLMLQYQRQGKRDEAAQVAMQILRSTTGGPQARALSRSQSPTIRRPPAPPPSASWRARAGSPSSSSEPTTSSRKHPIRSRSIRTLADYYTAARQSRQSQGRAGQARRASSRRRRPAAPGRQPVRAGAARPTSPLAITRPPSRKTRSWPPDHSPRSRTCCCRPAGPKR